VETVSIELKPQPEFEKRLDEIIQEELGERTLRFPPAVIPKWEPLPPMPLSETDQKFVRGE
jgi:hypothetical protein